MKVLRNFVLVFAVLAALPSNIGAQNQNKTVCYDEVCVFEILEKMISDDVATVADAEQTLSELVDTYIYTKDSRIKYALKNSIIAFVEKFSECKSDQFLISLLPQFCSRNDIDDIFQLIDNEHIADFAIRAMGDMNGSGDYFVKYIDRNHDDLKYQAALAYAIGRQHLTSFENELISWLDDADEPTKIDIYNALLVIRSNEQTTKIIEKGAKKLNKSKISENKIAGMRLLTALNGEKALPMLNKALKHKDGNVRRAALELMKPFANQTVVKNVMKRCKKGEAFVDAINWIGDIKDETQMELIINQLSSNDSEVVNAAIRAIFKIDNIDGINAVKPMFGTVYQEVIKESMVNYKGDYRAILNDLLKNGNDRQKLASLQILESRPTNEVNQRVQELLSSDSQAVRDEAYKILKIVTSAKDTEFLMRLLEYCNEKYVEDVQFGIKKATETLPTDRKDHYALTLKHVKSDVMPRYYKVFAFFGTELCVEKLIDAYQNGDYKFDAKEALLMVENKNFENRINEVLKD